MEPHLRAMGYVLLLLAILDHTVLRCYLPLDRSALLSVLRDRNGGSGAYSWLEMECIAAPAHGHSAKGFPPSPNVHVLLNNIA